MKTLRKKSFFVLSLIILCVFINGCYLEDRAFAKVNAVLVKCKLNYRAYYPDTQDIDVGVGVAGGGQIATAIIPTGSKERYLTIWDCKEYGFLNSESKDVFIKAKETSYLYIKTYKNKSRIVGIQ